MALNYRSSRGVGRLPWTGAKAWVPHVLGPETRSLAREKELRGVNIPQPAHGGLGWGVAMVFERAGGHFPAGISGSQHRSGRAGQARGSNAERGCFRPAAVRNPNSWARLLSQAPA